jgi:hypothetical protein
MKAEGKASRLVDISPSHYEVFAYSKSVDISSSREFAWFKLVSPLATTGFCSP